MHIDRTCQSLLMTKEKMAKRGCTGFSGRKIYNEGSLMVDTSVLCIILAVILWFGIAFKVLAMLSAFFTCVRSMIRILHGFAGYDQFPAFCMRARRQDGNNLDKRSRSDDEEWH